MKIVWEKDDLKYGATASTEDGDYMIIGKDGNSDVFGLIDDTSRFIKDWMTADEVITFLTKKGCDCIE